MSTSANVTLVSEVGSACDEPGTRTMVRMEEQMALLMQKLEEQFQQMKCLTDRQSTQLEEVERRQYQMEKRVNSLM